MLEHLYFGHVLWENHDFWSVIYTVISKTRFLVQNVIIQFHCLKIHILFYIDGLCTIVYMSCKLQANWMKIQCTWFFRTDSYLLKMTIKFWFIYESQNAQHIWCALNYIYVRIWCESDYNFWNFRPKWDTILMIHIIWIWKQSSWQVM